MVLGLRIKERDGGSNVTYCYLQRLAPVISRRSGRKSKEAGVNGAESTLPGSSEKIGVFWGSGGAVFGKR